MANVNVSYEEMRTAATRLTTGENDMNGKLTELQSYISGLVSSGFVTDSASVSFNEAFLKFKTETTRGLTALSEMSTYLQTAATRLKETDDSLMVTFG